MQDSKIWETAKSLECPLVRYQREANGYSFYGAKWCVPVKLKTGNRDIERQCVEQSLRVLRLRESERDNL